MVFPVALPPSMTSLSALFCAIPARELCRKHAISDATFYTWRKKYGGMEVPEVKRLKSLEEENARLKKLLAEAMLDKEALQVALGRKY
ncbi:transposase [Escherichia coli]|nr:transposase [Escherichia coli]BEB42048.1 transposase [Escherichia coli]